MAQLTIKQLTKKDSPEYISDKKLLQILIHERINKLTQVYSPLSTRLHELRSKVDNCIPENINPIN
jgi:hypothetical protein